MPPLNIRKARHEHVRQLAYFGEVTFDVVADAFAFHTKSCDNVGCDELQLSEDRTSALMCTGCCHLGHVSHECSEVCSRCNQAKEMGFLDLQRDLMRVLRPAELQGRVIPPLRERLRMEAERLVLAMGDAMEGFGE